jgi:hypothetical protein
MDFKGQKCGNQTQASTTDGEAKLVRKGPGKEARLWFAGHAVMENRYGLCVLFDVTPAAGAYDSAVAVDQVSELRNRGVAPRTIRADKEYRSQELVREVCEQGVVPHPARKDG